MIFSFIKNRTAGLMLKTVAMISLLAGVVFFTTANMAANAQQLPKGVDPDAVVFSVNGKEYTNRDLAVSSIDFGKELERVRPEERRDALINIVIDMLLLAQEGEKENLREDDEFKRRMKHLEARTLRNFYVRRKIQPLVTEELLQERYVEALARFEPETQIRARHILVETEDEAKALIVELDGGKDFAQLAQEKSTGPSAPNGGDLGFFGAGQMVAPFQEAASKLQAGEYTKVPVKTQFGWHVIKVEETRESAAPTYAEISTQLKGQVLGQLFQSKVDALRKAAKVEIAPPPTPPADAEKKAE